MAGNLGIGANFMTTNQAPFSFSLSAEWGPNDPEVESIWVLFKDAVKKIDDEKINDEADFRADRIYEKLREARSHYMVITRDGFDLQPSSERAAAFNSLYGCLWSAYKNRFTSFTESFGYDTGFIFAGKDYEQQVNGFIKRHPEASDLKEFIDLQKKSWQDNLRDNRNANEHDGDFRTKEGVPDFNDKESAKQIFIAATRTIEMVGMKLVSYKLPESLNVILVNNKATVFDRVHRFEIRHAMQGLDPTPLFDNPYH